MSTPHLVSLTLPKEQHSNYGLVLSFYTQS